MIVTVFKTEQQVEVKKEVKVTSVVLERNEDPSKILLFYCPVCTRPLIQYKGRIAFILPGEVPCNIPLLIECKRCKTNFMFRTNV